MDIQYLCTEHFWWHNILLNFVKFVNSAQQVASTGSVALI